MLVEHDQDLALHHFGLSPLLLMLVSRGTPTRITSKGQVTIPQEVRNRLGLLPHTEVEFEVRGDPARIRKARRGESSGVRGQKALRALRDSADTPMSSNEIMALTRGSRRAGVNRKLARRRVMGPLLKGGTTCDESPRVFNTAANAHA